MSFGFSKPQRRINSLHLCQHVYPCAPVSSDLFPCRAITLCVVGQHQHYQTSIIRGVVSENDGYWSPNNSVVYLPWFSYFYMAKMFTVYFSHLLHQSVWFLKWYCVRFWTDAVSELTVRLGKVPHPQTNKPVQSVLFYVLLGSRYSEVAHHIVLR